MNPASKIKKGAEHPAPEVEEAVLNIGYEYPAYGQARASNELRKKGVLISGGVENLASPWFGEF